MFERNKIDNVDQSGVPVEITLTDGEVIKGRVMVAMGRNIFEVLNAPGGFLEFEHFAVVGERTFIAKSALQNVKLINVPRAQNLTGRLRDLDGFDPLSILGLPTSANFEDVKAAWHRLAKIYHPDRYSSAELPQEVRDYLEAMARRINAAYAALEVPMQSARRAAVNRAAPIYSSSQRA